MFLEEGIGQRLVSQNAKPKARPIVLGLKLFFAKSIEENTSLSSATPTLGREKFAILEFVEMKLPIKPIVRPF